MDDDDLIIYICFFCAGAVFLLFLLLIFGVLETPLEKLNIDEDALASSHVKQYYPEYENCTIIYDYDLNRQDFKTIPGVEVNCGLDNRDGMRLKSFNPIQKIEFDTITIEQIFIIKLYECMRN